jgi:hypothetical protein
VVIEQCARVRPVFRLMPPNPPGGPREEPRLSAGALFFALGGEQPACGAGTGVSRGICRPVVILDCRGELRQPPEPIHQCREPVLLRTVGNSLQGARLALFLIDHPSQVQRREHRLALCV